MKVLIASTPASGHIDPMFSLGRLLVRAGHEVVGLSANAMRARIEAAGAGFRSFPRAADFDLRDIVSVFPEYEAIPPGLEMSQFLLQRVFIDAIPAQHQGLKAALCDFPADIILADNFFFGALPMLLGPRCARPPIVLCGTMFLHYHRDDGAPNFAGLPPAMGAAELSAYAGIAKLHDEVLYAPVRAYLNKCLAGLGVAPLEMDVHEAVVALPDAYLQLTVPSFEFPRRDLPASVHFVGTPPIIPNQAPLPAWTHDLGSWRKIVLVSQGTVSNHDFRQLISPTLAALCNQPDVLVIATTGGRPTDALYDAIPGNARVAQYLPFEWLLPKVDVLVTNGGYGSVNQALSFGIPLVTAGLTEDKADTNVRVAWSGVGIDLRTQRPSPSAIVEAVRAVLDQPDYRARASSMAREFARIESRRQVLAILDRVARARVCAAQCPVERAV
jgi:UDP:flavonoid glycosyltransferase YjiC (YdhE family)